MWVLKVCISFVLRYESHLGAPVLSINEGRGAEAVPRLFRVQNAKAVLFFEVRLDP